MDAKERFMKKLKVAIKKKDNGSCALCGGKEGLRGDRRLCERCTGKYTHYRDNT